MEAARGARSDVREREVAAERVPGRRGVAAWGTCDCKTSARRSSAYSESLARHAEVIITFDKKKRP